MKETLTSNHQADKKALLKKSGANCFGWKCAAVGIAVVCQAVSKKCTSPPPSTPLHMCVCRGRAHSSLAYSSPCFSGPTYVGVYVGTYVCTYVCMCVVLKMHLMYVLDEKVEEHIARVQANCNMFAWAPVDLEEVTLLHH